MDIRNETKIDPQNWDGLPSFSLPPYAINENFSGHLFYGAENVIRRYLQLRYTPKNISGYWAHGWTPDFFCIEPNIALGWPIKDVKGTCWVGTKQVARYLQSNGVPARAIGLPIAYLHERDYERKKSSLLVMPIHSMAYTKHTWDFRGYAESIRRIKDEFDFVAVCLNHGCLRNGYWVNEFKEIGIHIIEGAHLFDNNSLERIRALLSQFEFVTTNGFGSHIVYAAAFGAKVSIYGPFCECKEDDFREDLFYCSIPGLAQTAIPLTSESFIRSHLPDLFCHPLEAHEKVTWGKSEIGYHNRITPNQMRKLFGLMWYDPPLNKTEQTFQAIANRHAVKNIRSRIVTWVNPAIRREANERKRIRDLQNDEPGAAKLNGMELFFSAANSFMQDYKRIFEQKQMDFPCIKGSPRIVDWNAGDGLAVRYWASVFPHPRIDVFTANANARSALKKNIDAAGTATVSFHNDFSALPSLFTERIDFLHLELTFENTAVFMQIADNLLHCDRLLFFWKSQIGRPQNVSVILALLEKLGFRYHLCNRYASVNPLRKIRALAGNDSILDIWGYLGERFPWMEHSDR